MKQEEWLALLAELVACQAPPGEEKEVEEALRPRMEALGVPVWRDSVGNLYAHVEGSGPRVMLCAHMDEVAMVVADVLEDGRAKVEACGGSWPWKYGEGPVELLADDGRWIAGILSIGSVHTTTGPVHELKSSRPLTWDLMTVFTGWGKEELLAQGVHVGTRVLIARHRKQLLRLGEYLASFALDDRMGLTALMALLQEAAQGGLGSALDLYFGPPAKRWKGVWGRCGPPRASSPTLSSPWTPPL